MKDSDIDYTKPRFELGVVLVTPAGLAALEAAQIPEVLLLARHVHGDWGELSEEDRLQNELAVLLGLRLLSSYPLPTGGKVWVITEADRSATTILLPDDY
ncbi:hypothetical protein QZM25_32065 [Burkholderia contaminans]|jgi:hypothetical protein|uniref:hypothetical protein n=1 Tax=Burkholderiaceae TaxID=119060 RepID=UPI0008771D3F|nr:MULTISPECIES: hypothetical protein [Burkholderiaceae]KAE9848418.1 hypothetical protein GP671_29705 [Escherichia coli]MBA9860090.1 hypothetical protein [Ralstonia insidiosa]MBA9940837.1 hypothetical protein [Ralstonia insidiosa]MBX3905239.1 hypothetical protein [Ralstonia insidiosa]MDN7577252.1 hypothetical protein [Burkholderia contaminans]